MWEQKIIGAWLLSCQILLKNFVPERESEEGLGETKRQAATRNWPFIYTTVHTVDAMAEERRKRSSLFRRGHQERDQQQQKVAELTADFYKQVTW